ncbi:thermonuclease family protein [Patescibacteria group bacterium]|nr:thermonuclease family protein [Patescibacteria group bacterium]
MRNNPELPERPTIPFGRLAAILVLAGLSGCNLIIEDIQEEFDPQSIEQAPDPEPEQAEKEKAKIIPICKGKKPKPGPFLTGKEPVDVVCVVDGDTFDVRLKNHNGRIMRVRLRSVECPESWENEKCMRSGKKECKKQVKEGRKAKNRSRSMFGNGHGYLMPKYHNDPYGRKVTEYYLQNGVQLSRQLIRKGLCTNYYKSKRKR